MGYHLNYLDAPVFMAVPKPMLTELALIIDWRVVGMVLGKLKFGEINYLNKWNFELDNKQAE